MAKEVPAFGSEEEEAEFWDIHDTLDYAEGASIDLELDRKLATKIADRQKTKQVTLRLK